jgi:hypothetical protein
MTVRRMTRRTSRKSCSRVTAIADLPSRDFVNSMGASSPIMVSSMAYEMCSPRITAVSVVLKPVAWLLARTTGILSSLEMRIPRFARMIRSNAHKQHDAKIPQEYPMSLVPCHNFFVNRTSMMGCSIAGI